MDALSPSDSTPQPGAGQALIASFIARFDALVAASDWEEGPLSDRLFKRSGRIRDLRSGGNIGVLTLDRASDVLTDLEAANERRLASKGEAA